MKSDDGSNRGLAFSIRELRSRIGADNWFTHRAEAELSSVVRRRLESRVGFFDSRVVLTSDKFGVLITECKLQSANYRALSAPTTLVNESLASPKSKVVFGS